ncbi:putative serine/threonine-protein kinase [Phalaenopsis equestris]|uniref:putative serine/threonine-protein kinase n=1 Tax=Phalaenopsis equestris TaxID=78828 RepID=UPI0009E589A9|nr:putative serine/threonine-protein kinase [Phalaenopsis equestris]
MTKPTGLLDKLIKPFNRRHNRDFRKEEEDLEAIAAKETKVFRYETLAAATRNFSVKHKLGEGGFGLVYKGQLEDGRMVAVKRLGRWSLMGGEEFTNEAMLLSRVQHKNVVTLYGYCTHVEDKLLVYEYVLNESLDKILFSREDKEATMMFDWKKRYDVMIGVARGLQYLHEDAHTPIIHSDIKASNILLDERFCPKIADFGMARLFPEDLTHVNTRVAGTNGYMAPEYAMYGYLSTKVDVFSFGVLIIELITGQKNSTFTPRSDASTLLEWAWRLHKKRQTMEMLDPALESIADTEQVVLCAHVGLLCTQADPKVRPEMRRVVVILSKKPSALEEPIRPGAPGSRYRMRAHGSASKFSSTSSGASTSAYNIASSSKANDTATVSSPLASAATSSSTTPVRSSMPLPYKFHHTI